MRGTMTAGAVALAGICAVALYAVTLDTRRLEARVHALERTAERTESDIVALKGEFSHLARPERIEPLARALGLRAPVRQQFVPEDRLPRREGPRP